jgi:hypothetical protein
MGRVIAPELARPGKMHYCPPVTDESIAAQARAADLAKVRRARSMTAFEKFEAGASLFEEACEWAMAGIAHQFPNLDSIAQKKELTRRLRLATGTRS